MYYKIGVDVGGTNTGAVLVDHHNEIFAETKQTTTDVSSGIENAIRKVMIQGDIPKEKIQYVMLGTIHCTNVLVERKELNRVGAIRICLPASRGTLLWQISQPTSKPLSAGILIWCMAAITLMADPLYST